MHAILRGNDRSAMFFEESDHRFFLGCPREAAVEENVAVHAYVLMTNHVHLLMPTCCNDCANAPTTASC